MPFFVVIEAPQRPREPDVLGPFPHIYDAQDAALGAIEEAHHDIRDLVGSTESTAFQGWDDMDEETAIEAYNDWARGNDAERIVIGRSPGGR
jgi:hypothetical protein